LLLRGKASRALEPPSLEKGGAGTVEKKNNKLSTRSMGGRPRSRGASRNENNLRETSGIRTEEKEGAIGGEPGCERTEKKNQGRKRSSKGNQTQPGGVRK